MSKKEAKKEAAKLEKLGRKQEREQEEEEEAIRTLSPEEEDESFFKNYGDVEFADLQSTSKWREARKGKEWTDVKDLVEEKVGLEDT
ncbi:unnamed protein product [Arabis nemorensis]|uniref:Uncharacterized protein n=1 Tax=Arabis nemorensis TaxID=586526 RepID=A0A565BCY8_9BRAS|nr:unnamed protein product [Arabis nemorensis]